MNDICTLDLFEIEKDDFRREVFQIIAILKVITLDCCKMNLAVHGQDAWDRNAFYRLLHG